MKYNKYTYTVFGKAQFELRKTLGFVGGNFSDDGEYVVGDKGDSKQCEGCDHSLPKPDYIPNGWFHNWPHLSHSEAEKLISIIKTSPNSHDGFKRMKDR